MKKAIFTSLVLVLLVMTGCSRSELTPTDPTASNGSVSTKQDQDITFAQTENSLYTPSGELLINLTWFNDVGKLNTSVTLAKIAVTSEDSFTAYIVGGEYEVQDFFENVQEVINWYKADSQNKNRESGGFELYGDWWEIKDLKIEDLEMVMEQVDFYYTFRFVKGDEWRNSKGANYISPF